LTQSLESLKGEWSCAKPLSAATLQFFVEYVYTGQIAQPSTIHLIPLVFLVKYLKLSGEKEVENIIVSSVTRELNDSSQDVMYVAAQEWGAKCVMDVIDRYRATRKP
jgi:hypothetical protein